MEQARAGIGGPVRLSRPRAVAGLSLLPNRVGEGTGGDRAVQRASAVPTEPCRLIMGSYKTPVNALVLCRQRLQRGRTRAGRR